MNQAVGVDRRGLNEALNVDLCLEDIVPEVFKSREKWFAYAEIG